jgi:HlyD family secretion protein
VLRRKWLLVVLVLGLGGATAAYVLSSTREEGTRVSSERIDFRSLEAIVSASGKLEPRRSVNISAQSMGRVTRLAVNEGDRVKAGQFLLQIDPVNAAAAVQRDEAAVEAARTGLEQVRTQLQSARANLELARQTLRRQQDLWDAGLTAREQLDRAQTEVDVRESELAAREQEIRTREQQLRQQEAGLASSRHALAQVRFDAPFDGIVTRRNIEEGENVVVGTMNNPGTVLLTVADMSVLEAQVEVDETDIPLVEIGQDARVTVDAVPNRTFRGRVTEIGNSPIQATGQQQAGARTATNFKVVVTLEEEVPGVRPGFTCTAEITTATRERALSVPIQALTIREQEYDTQGALVPRERPAPASRWARPSVPAATPVQAASLPPGHTRREIEGVFVVRDGRAAFVPVVIGIAGERHFEVLEGLREGDIVITGPFESVRNMFDGDPVRVEDAAARR